MNYCRIYQRYFFTSKKCNTGAWREKGQPPNSGGFDTVNLLIYFDPLRQLSKTAIQYILDRKYLSLKRQ